VNDILDIAKADATDEVIDDLGAQVDVELRVTARVLEIVRGSVLSGDGRSVAHAKVFDALPGVRGAKLEPQRGAEQARDGQPRVQILIGHGEALARAIFERDQARGIDIPKIRIDALLHSRNARKVAATKTEIGAATHDRDEVRLGFFAFVVRLTRVRRGDNRRL
jgi:hypothetical protein